MTGSSLDELDDAGWDYGAPLSDIRRLVQRWKDGYDWRKHEARLTTRCLNYSGYDVDDLGLEAFGSQEDTSAAFGRLSGISRLSCRALSLPGYGFSEAPKTKGFGPHQYAEVGNKLMLALGYNEYVTQGGDWGHLITRRIAQLYGHKHSKAWHTNMQLALPPHPTQSPLLYLSQLIFNYTAAEKAGLARTWIYEKLVNWTDKYPWDDDEVLTWILYIGFLVQAQLPHCASTMKLDTNLEIVVLPKNWLKAPNLVFESQHDSGGHFAAHEKPKELVGDLRKMLARAGLLWGRFWEEWLCRYEGTVQVVNVAHHTSRWQNQRITMVVVQVLSPAEHENMSISLNPSNTLDFKRPLMTLVKRSLTITNNNAQAIAFKVKTTAPKLYCTIPNSGRVEPGESINVSVMLQALKEEPPLDTKCKDKFVILSTIITPDNEKLALHDIVHIPPSMLPTYIDAHHQHFIFYSFYSTLVGQPGITEEGKVFRQKLYVAYLTADSQTLEEDDEDADETASNVTVDESRSPSLSHKRHISLSMNPLRLNKKKYPFLSTPAAPLASTVRVCSVAVHRLLNPIAFKILTTAPKVGWKREVAQSLVMFQGLKEEPPLDTECKDKFIIFSTIITPDKKKLALQDICANLEINEQSNVLRQELGVTYLPAEDWYSIVLDWQNRTSSNIIANEPLPVNGNIFANDAHRYFMAPAPPEEIVYDEQRTQLPPPEVVHSEARIPVPAAPALEPIYIMRENPINEEMAENERLKAQIASLTPTRAEAPDMKLSDLDGAAGLEETQKGQIF
ncbi:Alpha/Beta hydrolase protein [Pholiota molesta]|nr:Alpha/Beta hydrolase protein [Pholiota molesta]